MELEEILAEEELYWQQRGKQKWILEGDANTTFFHLVANGRKRKKAILNLENQGKNIVDGQEIKELIYKLYKALFGKQKERNVHLSQNVWAQDRRLERGDREILCQPFTEEEVKRAIFDMKVESAPGNGFSVTFYRSCWEFIKEPFMNMVNDFYRGKLDMVD